MVYILIGVIVLIMIATFANASKLGQLLFSINTIKDKISELTDDTKKISEFIKEKADLEKENINKKVAKKLNIDYSSYDYMTKIYGYIEQTKMFSISQIIYEIEQIPVKDINEYVKQHYLMMFALMMQKNNLKFEDFKIGSTYAGAGPHEYYFIKFELKNTQYFGWDEWISKGTLIAEMANGEIKEFEVENYANKLEKYFDTEDEYKSIHFFDALVKTYSSFSFDDESYSSIGGYNDDKYVIVLNDLIQQYNNIGKKWNVIFADAMSVSLDHNWHGKLEDMFINTRIIDTSWAIDKFQEVQVLDWEIIREKREKIFNSLSESLDNDERFRLATMYYYEQFDTNWNDEKNSHQKEAIKIWKELAENGHAYSQLVIGILHFDGTYLLKNFSKSKKYIELAFDNGIELPAKKVWEDLKLYNY